MSCPRSQPALRQRVPEAMECDNEGFQYSPIQPHILLPSVLSCFGVWLSSSSQQRSLPVTAQLGSSCMGKAFPLSILNLLTFQPIEKIRESGLGVPVQTILFTANKLRFHHYKYREFPYRNLASNYCALGISKQVMFENCPPGTGLCQRIASARTSVRGIFHVILSPLLAAASEDCLWCAGWEHASHLQ